MQCGVINITMVDTIGSCGFGQGPYAQTQYTPSFQQCINYTTGQTSGGLLKVAKQLDSACFPSGIISWNFQVDAGGLPGGSIPVGIAPYTLMHELGHILGLRHAGNCANNDPNLMADGNCSTGIFKRWHGPLHEDIAAVRKANGGSLTRLSNGDDHFNSFGAADGSSWQSQGDNFTSALALSSVAVAANNSQAANGRFVMAYHSILPSDELVTISGYVNNWDYLSEFVWSAPSARTRGQPAIAATGWSGDYLAVYTAVDSSVGTSNARNAKAVFLDDYGSGWGPIILPFASVEPPSVSFVRPNNHSSGYWVVAYMGASQPGITVRTAALTANHTASWSTPVALVQPVTGQSSTEALRALGGVSIACKTYPFGADDGRCIVSYATDGSRADEQVSVQTGFLRTASIRILSDGSVYGAVVNTTTGDPGLQVVPGTFGFSSGNKTFGSTSAAYNRRTGTWHMAWAHTGSACYWWMRAAAGGSSWPAPTCFFIDSVNATTTPTLLHTDYWDAMVYFRNK